MQEPVTPYFAKAFGEHMLHQQPGKMGSGLPGAIKAEVLKAMEVEPNNPLFPFPLW